METTGCRNIKLINDSIFLREEIIKMLSLSLLFLFPSCHAKKTQHIPPPERTAVYFINFSITKDEAGSKNNITLLNKTQTSAQLKPRPKNNAYPLNYLTVYVYNSKNTVFDSILIEHPLYKHLEYAGAGNAFMVKDTIVPKEDFFFRVETLGQHNKLKIVETLNGKTKKELLSIDL